jgi:hypothetical protein
LTRELAPGSSAHVRPGRDDGVRGFSSDPPRDTGLSPWRRRQRSQTGDTRSTLLHRPCAVTELAGRMKYDGQTPPLSAERPMVGEGGQHGHRYVGPE